MDYLTTAMRLENVRRDSHAPTRELDALTNAIDLCRAMEYRERLIKGLTITPDESTHLYQTIGMHAALQFVREEPPTMNAQEGQPVNLALHFENSQPEGIICNHCRTPWPCLVIQKARSERGYSIGPDAPITTNERGGSQSFLPCRFDLIDAAAERRLAEILHYGAAKYGDNNWRKISTDDHINHALNHINAHRAGDQTDDHPGHAYCRMMMALAVHLSKPLGD